MKQKRILMVAAAGAAAVVVLVLCLVLPGKKLKAEAVDRVSVSQLCTLAPEDFVQAPDGVRASFRRAPDMGKHGTQRVRLLLTDSEGHKGRVTAGLRLLRLRGLTFELGNAPTLLTPQDLLLDSANATAVAFAGPPPQLVALGEYPVTLRVDRQDFALTLVVADTIQPTAKAISREGQPGQVWKPEDFVQSVTDRSEVTLRFAEQPDFFLRGTQNITVIITDEGGNTAEVKATLKITGDAVTPIIVGAHDIEAERYSAIAYRAGVKAYDARGNELELQVDNSKVDTDFPGEYSVLYSAVDGAGQKVEARVKVTVLPVGEDKVAALADPILAQIITPGMTDTQKAKAIHTWVNTNIAYSNEGEKEDILDGAYNGLTLRRGDCYTYFALSKYLLSREGIEGIDLERIPGTDMTHYWMLLNLGDGWRHYDTTRVKAAEYRPNNGFMMTESQAQAFCKATHQPDFYTYRPEMLPAGIKIVE
ncbi:MAG: hypothetical protein FWF60_07330 [Oscillospiraceae bacterium]|nr:hypothetical protein [Oscillospiraceae bacterium]